MCADTIRIGFIGAGSISRSNHLPGLAAIDGVRLVAVCNRSRESSQAVASEFSFSTTEDDWRTLIARDDIDAVFIGTWPYMHKEMSTAVLEAGKHCFCQARMCMNLAEAKPMLAAAQAHPDLVNMISPAPHPLEHYLREVVHSGRLGQLTSVELRVIGSGNLDRTSVTWREQVEFSGNQIMFMGIYAEMLNAIVGPYETLSASLSTPIAEKTDENSETVQIGIPQVVAISGRLECGALAVEHHSGVNADKTGVSSLTIRGLEGTAIYDLGDSLQIGAAGEPMSAVDVPAERRTGWTVEEDFIGAVRAARAGTPPAERPVRPDFAEGILYMRKVEAVHQSARTGQAVELAKL
jgi:predicted dehydrogenase